MAISERLALLVTLDANGAIKGFNDLGKAADKNLSKADQKLDRMASRFQKAGAGMLATAGLLGAGLFKAGQSASDLGEVVSQTSQIFGESQGKIGEFAEGAASSLGQSERAAREAANTFGLFFTNAGKSGDEAAKMSIELASLASDMASFKNTSPEQAVQALGAALRGESEPIRAYGVMLDDATLKQRAYNMGLISTTTGVLPPAIKMQAAYAEILDQTKTIQGDFARTSGGLANQQRILAAEFENAKASLGQSITPVLADVVGGLAGMARGFTDANEASNGFLSKLAAMGTVGLAVGGGLSFTVGKLIDMRDTLAPLGGRLRTAEGGLTKLGKAGAALGVAGAVAGLAAMAAESGKVAVNVSDLERRLAKLNNTNKESLKELIVSAEAFGNLDTVVRQAADASVPLAERLIEQAAALGLSETRVAELNKIVEEKRVTDVKAAQDQAAYSAEVDSAAGSVGGLTEAVDVNKESLDLATESANLFKQGLEEAFGDLTLEEAADRRAQAFEDMASRFDDAQQSVKDAKQRVADLQAIKPEDRGDSWARDLAAAQAEVQEAIDATSRSLVGNSEAALQNREDIRGAVDDIGAIIQLHRDQGASLEELAYIRAIEKQGLEDQLTQLGFNKEEIQRYIAAIDEIPITKATTVTVDQAKAEANLKAAMDRLQAYIDANPLSMDVAQAEKFATGAHPNDPRRAIGGPVSAGSSYLVGEYGRPEVFTPSVSGTISPVGSSSGVTSQVNNITINNPTPEPANTSIRKVRSELAA